MGETKVVIDFMDIHHTVGQRTLHPYRCMPGLSAMALIGQGLVRLAPCRMRPKN